MCCNDLIPRMFACVHLCPDDPALLRSGRSCCWGDCEVICALAVLQMLLKEKQAASSPRKCGADAANARDGRVSRADGTVAGQLLIQTAVAWMAGDGGQIVFWPVVTFLGAAYFITATYVGYQIFGLFFPAVSS